MIFSPTRLHADRLRMEKFVYEKGTNVALYNAEHSQRYQAILDKFHSLIKKQIQKVANENDIKTLRLFTKAKSVNQDLINEISIVLGTTTADSEIEMVEYLDWAGSQGGQAAMDKLGISGVFGLKNPELIQYFDDHSKLLLDGVDETTKRWVADQIQEGKDLGLTDGEVAKKMTEQSDIYSYARAEMIVLTETAAAMTKVEVATSASYGIEQKTWRTSLDDRVDPICADLDSETVSINDDFSTGDDGPPAHPNCRCFLEYLTPVGWDPTIYEEPSND